MGEGHRRRHQARGEVGQSVGMAEGAGHLRSWRAWRAGMRSGEGPCCSSLAWSGPDGGLRLGEGAVAAEITGVPSPSPVRNAAVAVVVVGSFGDCRIPDRCLRSDSSLPRRIRGRRWSPDTRRRRHTCPRWLCCCVGEAADRLDVAAA